MWYSAVGFVVTLTLSLLVVPLTTDAQQPTQVFHIGVLNPGSPLPGPTSSFELFRQGLRDLGYVEGQNLLIERRYAEGSAERLHDLAAELVRRNVALLLPQGVAATRAAQQATSLIPIVMTGGGVDSVAEGFVVSLARLGGNITGVSALYGPLVAKRLELLKETVPHLARLAILMNPAHPAHAGFLRETQRAAHALGVELHVLEVRSRDELESPVSGIHGMGVDALCIFQDPLLNDYRHDIAALALQHRLATLSPWRSFVEAGSLMSYGPDDLDFYQRAAYYVDRILKGTKPADLPVEQPTKFALVINLKTAKALRLTVPPSLLLLADEVIQ
jgi:putative ABC transport system substrate-binding protein